jgi:hypothetical protein
MAVAQSAGIQIGELSRRTGCNIETIRYYERIALLRAPAPLGVPDAIVSTTPPMFGGWPSSAGRVNSASRSTRCALC